MFLDQLSEDHKNFSRVLGLLQRQLDELQRDEAPDYYLMLKFVQYFEEHPARCHHPVEDALFSVYLQRSAEGADIIETLLKEHSVLEKNTLDLREQVELALAGQDADPIKLINLFSGFLQRQRDHIATEEIKVFPLLGRVLDENDWASVTRRLALQKDPLCGLPVAQEYEALYHQDHC